MSNETRWRDGMGRVTIKRSTGSAHRGDLVWDQGKVIGVCRAPDWLLVYGVCRVRIYNFIADGLWRAAMATKARYRRQQRHGPKTLRSKGNPNWRLLNEIDDVQ